jgi:NAD(P)-dependent dehydrogenase (short-subunit alcohol dehydrogenase family)
MQGLTGKVALVTGGSRGIGAAIARRLAADGADVVITYVQAASAPKADALVAGIAATGRRAAAFAADNADPAEATKLVDRCAEEFGRLDILVNNAAVSTYKTVGDFTLDEINETLNVNIRAPFIASQAAIRHMGEGGRIINIGSTVATRMPRTTGSLYATSKAALIGMTKGMARDLGPRGITVNMVNPGPTRTGMLAPDGSEVAEKIRSFMAVHDFAQPDDIAGLVAYVASPESRFVTGALLNVDGGYTV